MHRPPTPPGVQRIPKKNILFWNPPLCPKTLKVLKYTLRTLPLETWKTPATMERDQERMEETFLWFKLLNFTGWELKKSGFCHCYITLPPYAKKERKLTQNTRNILKRLVEMINPIIMKIAHDIRIHLEKIVQVRYEGKLANLRKTQLHSGFRHIGNQIWFWIVPTRRRPSKNTSVQTIVEWWRGCSENTLRYYHNMKLSLSILFFCYSMSSEALFIPLHTLGRLPAQSRQGQDDWICFSW